MNLKIRVVAFDNEYSLTVPLCVEACELAKLFLDVCWRAQRKRRVLNRWIKIQ